MNLPRPLLLLLAACAPFAARAELRVPAHTAYVLPDHHGARVNAEGVTRWRGPAQTILWGGELKQPGELTARVELRLPAGKTSTLRLAVHGTAVEREIRGTDAPVTADFGAFAVKEAGYARFELSSRNADGAENGDLIALVLDGPAAANAHFNLKTRRNAASIHLAYAEPAGEKVEWFYGEATAVEDPVHTFYMACGFSRGYFGMQVNSPAERRIIFSIWDAGEGGSADRRDQVKPENHTQLVAKGEGVHASVFGGEGTGGHSHLKYMWKTGEPQRFAVRAQPKGDHTVYSGYWFHPENKAWMLIASFDAPKDGKTLRGLHSFVENFGGETGHLRRKARFGNLWVRTPDGRSLPIVKASFSHDATGQADRLDRHGGVEQGAFFLANGGFLPGYSKYGDPFTLPNPPAIAPTWPE